MKEYKAKDFYNNIADKYHWFFSSWDKLMESKARYLDEILKKYNVANILDCSCGTGLQAIGLAKLGYKVDGGDISKEMIKQAKDNAINYGVEMNFKVSDFRELNQNFNSEYDAVISWGNSIPHLMNDKDIMKTLDNIYKCTKIDGVALFDMRNFDLMLKEKNRFLPMRINDIKDGKRYSLIYVFDYLDHAIRFNILYLIEDLTTNEKHFESESVDYNPIKKQRFVNMLEQTGFKKIVIEESDTNIQYIAQK